MRIARVLSKNVGRPRVALERDNALYDVEALERAFAIELRSDDRAHVMLEAIVEPSDFQTRVSTLRCAGLYDLDMRLLRGERPSSARIADDDAMLLAPCDTERAAFIEVDTRALASGGDPVCRIGQARALSGQDCLAALDEKHGAPTFEVSLAAVIGDDLSRVSQREASSAIMGLSILVDWITVSPLTNVGSINVEKRGRAAQLGPHLVSRFTLPKLSDAVAYVRHGGTTHSAGRLSEIGLSIEEAIAFASGELELRAGDVITVGPLPRVSSESLGMELAFHDHVEVEIEGLGALRGIPVPVKPHHLWR